jgi:hypothetical protein
MKLKLKKLYFDLEHFKNEAKHSNISKITNGEKQFIAILESALEKTINKSVPTGGLYLGDTMASTGYQYEQKVIDSLKEAKISGNINESVGSNAASADADIKLFGKIFNIEIKLNSNAQMGGSSIRFNEQVGFSLASSMDKQTEDLLLSAINLKKENIDNLLEFVKNHPNEQEKKKKFPFTCRKSTWEQAQKNNLLINVKVPLNADFIAEHYSKKNVNYIQIGGAGLFYMKSNPAKLPVPKLEGNIVVEIRTGRSGSKFVKSLNEKVVAAGIRVQGRLKTKNKSPYSLDDSESIRRLIEATKS